MGCFALITFLLGGLFFGVATVEQSPSVAVMPTMAVVEVRPTAAPPTPIAMQQMTSIYRQIPQYRSTDGAYVLGGTGAPVEIWLYVDYLCPHCQRYEPTMNAIIQDYVTTGQVRLVHRTLPVINQQDSPYVSQLVECAELQRAGSFWDARATMFSIAEGRRSYSDELLQEFASEMNLSADDLLNCAHTVNQWETDADTAQNYNVRGTPAVIVFYEGTDIFIEFSGPPSLDELRTSIENGQ